MSREIEKSIVRLSARWRTKELDRVPSVVLSL
jgi:hypothetical protein